MQAQSKVDPWWAALTIWGVVNAVNVLQAAGFLSRVRTGSMAINHLLGYVIIALAVPAFLALVAFWRARAGWLHLVGPAVYLAFIVLMIVVEYIWSVEFRSPTREWHSRALPLALLRLDLPTGLPMYRLDRRLWLVTVATTALLLGSMGIAMRLGVG